MYSVAVKYVRIVGLKKARDKNGKLMKMLESTPYKVLVEEAATAQAEVNMEVPLDTGRLQAGSSIYVDPSSGKTKPTVVGESEAIDPETGYDYSTYQHDNPYLKHSAGRKAFFIRDPFNRMIERIDRRLEEEVSYDR